MNKKQRAIIKQAEWTDFRHMAARERAKAGRNRETIVSVVTFTIRCALGTPGYAMSRKVSY